MSNVFGNLRYFSRYSSIEELKEDLALREDKVVLVEDVENTISMYKIKKNKESSTEISLNNGLFAVKVLTGSNSMDLGSYSTKEPVRVTVGGVKQGREFDKASFSDVFNAIFYPEVDIYFEVNLNLSTLSYLLGEEVMLTDVSVLNIKSEEVSYLELYINDELVRRDEINAVVQSYQFLINRVITEDSEVLVKLVTRNSYLTVGQKITFGNPVYWGIVNKDYSPSSASVQRLNRMTVENNRVQFVFRSNGNCVFFAVDSKLKVSKVIDENMNNVLDNFIQGDVEVYFDDEKIVYKTYKSNVTCLSEDYSLQFILEEDKK